MFKILPLFISILICKPGFSQSNGSTLSGSIIDKFSKAAIEFAGVELLSPSDSTTIKGTITDAKGKFTMNEINRGNYLLRLSYIGYTKTIMPVSVEKTRVILEPIQISLVETQLEEVLVTSTRAILNTSIDRKSYDVTQDIMVQSGTAGDVLKNIPSVEVDLDGNISLRGSGDVMILINGRQSPLFSKLNRADVLQQFPANTIARIEVITNPPARFKPDGISGIINIVLKKNIKAGWNGSITGNAGLKNRFNASTTLNYNPGKFNLFGNFGIRHDNRPRSNSVDRNYYDTTRGAISGFYTENGLSLSRPLTHLATLGFEYNADKDNSFGWSGNYTNRTQVKDEINTKIFFDKNHNYTNYFNRLRYDPEFETEKDMTVFYEHKFPGDEHTLRVEGNFSTVKELEENHYQNKYQFPGSGSTYDNTKIFQGESQQLINIDYTHALSESENLEIGYSGTFEQNDFDFEVENLDGGSGIFVKDKFKTNRFLFNQSVHALYLTYQKNYKKLGYKIGFRTEGSLTSGKQITKDTVISNDYLKVYPTVHLSYALTDYSQLQLNYSRRVHRPEGDEINPFPEYQDPYNVRAGNADLLPEIVHSIEFGYKWQNQNFSIVQSLYYRYKQNGFTQVTLPISDSVLLTTLQNLSQDRSAGLELILSVKTGKVFSTNLNSNLFYNQINATNLGYFGKRNIISFSTNLNSTISITPTTMTQVSAIYYSSRITPQGKRYSTFVFNAGLRQDFLMKKLSIIVTASDILRTLWQKTELETLYLRQLAIGRRDGQILYIGFSYRFGSTLKRPDDKLQFE